MALDTGRIWRTYLVLYLGFSHPVRIEASEGISFEVDTKARQFKVMGYNAETVGQMAADIRKICHQSLTKVKAYITLVKRSVVKPASPPRPKHKSR